MKRALVAVVVAALGGGAAFGQDTPKPDAKDVEQDAKLERLLKEVEELKRERAASKRRRPAEENREPAKDPNAEPKPGEPKDPADIGANPDLAPGGSSTPGDQLGEAEEQHWTDKIKLGIFFIESTDKAYRLEIQGRIHVDANFIPDKNRDDFQNTIQVRRGRMTFVGHLFGEKRVYYKLGLEFGRSPAGNFRDCFIGLKVVDPFQIMVGQMLLPYSTERLTTSNVMMHPERPIYIGNAFEPREIGVQIWGQAFDKKLRYYAGVYNGNGQNLRFDEDDDKDLAARVELAPLSQLLLASSYVFSPKNRNSQGPTDVFTVGNQYTRFLDYDMNRNRRRGERHRAAAEARVRVANLEVKGEYHFEFNGDLQRTNSAATEDLVITSYFLDAAYCVLGTRDGEKIKPDVVFYDYETKKFGPGALDFAIRYEDYHVERAVISKGFATGTNHVKSVTGTVHWYLWQELRLSVSYTYSDFADDVPDSKGNRRDDDHAGLVRLTAYF